MKALVLFSGGIDSTTALGLAIKKYGKDQVIAIGDTNVCEIKNGEVKMTEANCPDHLCMKQPAVGSAGGYIVCLPNKVVIEGKKSSSSNSEDELVIDSVT